MQRIVKGTVHVCVCVCAECVCGVCEQERACVCMTEV